MQDPILRAFAALTASGALAAILCPASAEAQTIGARQGARPAARAARAARAAPPAPAAAGPLGRGHRLGPHHIFGTILAINGNLLSVLRRDGRNVTVDATAPLANNDYSYPLFVGKTVAIDGRFGDASRTTFTAVHVDAITTLQSLESDQ